MPPVKRAFSENPVYEIVPRTPEILPMHPTKTSYEIKLELLGRTQQDSKVDLSQILI
jgi:hypothetical protein